MMDEAQLDPLETMLEFQTRASKSFSGCISGVDMQCAHGESVVAPPCTLRVICMSLDEEAYLVISVQSLHVLPYRSTGGIRHDCYCSLFLIALLWNSL
jgi:hypothetical protein